MYLLNRNKPTSMDQYVYTRVVRMADLSFITDPSCTIWPLPLSPQFPFPLFLHLPPARMLHSSTYLTFQPLLALSQPPPSSSLPLPKDASVRVQYYF